MHTFFSPFTKKLWGKICEKKIVYVLLVASWLLPTMINLPKSFEADVDFQPGKNRTVQDNENGEEVGYLCYPTEDGKKVMWTHIQFVLNLTTDILVLLTIIISGTISWLSFKREVHDNRDKLEHDQLRLLRYNIIAKLKKKDLSLSVSIICITYIICRFPLAISGRYSGINGLTAWLQFCSLLYNLQFGLHFLVYAIFHNNYRDAYCDVLRKIFPCCNKLCCSNTATEVN